MRPTQGLGAPALKRSALRCDRHARASRSAQRAEDRQCAGQNRQGVV